LPDQPQPAQRQPADEIEQLEIDVERGVAFDRGRDRVTDLGGRRILSSNSASQIVEWSSASSKALRERTA
jgi:hypothetical protein